MDSCLTLGSSARGSFSDFCSVGVRAHNSRIGCSGAAALHPPTQLTRGYFWPSSSVVSSTKHCLFSNCHLGDFASAWLTWCLEHVQCFLVPLFRSLFCLLPILLALVLRPLRMQRTPLGQFCLFPLQGAATGLALPLGRVATVCPVLDWSATPVQLPKHLRPHPRRRLGLLHSLWSLLLAWSVGLHTVPMSVWSPPAFCLTPLLFLPSAHAMARPGQADPPDVLRPHQVPPEQLTTFAGTCDAPLPDADDREYHPHAAHLYQGPLPWNDATVCGPGEKWLGVYCYCPHYRMQPFAIKVLAEEGLQEVLDKVQQLAPGRQTAFCDTVRPLRPQRISGFLSVIQFPSAVRAFPEANAAVIADLTRVGGKYFPVVLPKRLAYDALYEYLRPMTSALHEEVLIYVGSRNRPWPPQAEVVLDDGEVITMIAAGTPPPSGARATDLFQSGAEWGPMHHFFRLECHEAVCILYRGARYSFCSYNHTGYTILDFVCERFRLDKNRILTCAFPIEDLDVQGDHCPVLVAVQDLPPSASADRQHRQDCFTLFDLRPFGLKPQFVHTHVPTHHVPSLAADFGITLPAHMCIGVLGGRLRGDVVKAEPNATLILHAQPSSSDSSDSDSVSPSPAQDPVLPARYGPPPPDPVSGLTDRVTDDDNWASPPWENTAIGLDGHAAPNPDPISFDSTLPAGHSWNVDSDPGWPLQPNLAAEVAPAAATVEPVTPLVSSHSQVDAATSINDTAFSVDPSIPSSDDASRVLPIIALVYVPDTLPELHTIALNFPCSVSHAIANVVEARSGNADLYYPSIIPVAPQPDAAVMTFLAKPAWFDAKPVVLFDCQRVNQTTFSCAVFRELSRESLLLAAGRKPSEQYAVYVHGLLRPLSVGQRISLTDGMLITLVPLGCGAPATAALENRLLCQDGWGDMQAVPGPPVLHGQHHWILTDAQPICFTVTDGRRPNFREDLLALLGSEQHRLTVRPSVPRINTGFFRGFHTTGVLVATEQVCRLPVPPARRAAPNTIIILDCRHLLRAFLWQVVQGTEIAVQTLVNQFADACPADHIVSIIGAPVQSRPTGAVFCVHDGIVLTVAYIENLLHSDISPAPFDPDDDNEDFLGPSDGIGPGRSGRSSTAVSSSRNAQAAHGDRHRSRSPRSALHRSVDEGSFSAFAVVARQQHRELQRLADMWRTVLSHDAFPEGTRFLTPVAQALIDGSLRASIGGLLSLVDQAFRIVGAPSRFVGLTSVQQQGLRLLLGLAQVHSTVSSPFFSSQIRSLTDAVPQGRDTCCARGNTSPDHSFSAVFVVLAPGYTHEQVDVDISAGQGIRQIIDRIDQARDPSRATDFPALLPIMPQPDARWGTLLAVPAWVTDTVLVCIDIYALDSRIFAAVVPRITDRHWLLQLAGFPPHADVEISCPRHPGFLDDSTEVRLVLGDCVTFASPTAHEEPDVSLYDMLQTHLGWAAGPPFPQQVDDARLYLVSDDLLTDFVMMPARAIYYKADIAACLHLRPWHLSITPAQPAVSDSAAFGRTHRTVTTVGEDLRQGRHGAAAAGLLDCRPLLSGWQRLSALDGWLDIHALKHSLNESAPAGWQVCVSDCPTHWSWLWLRDGQILVARFEPIPGGISEQAESNNAQTTDTGDVAPCRGHSADDSSDVRRPALQGRSEEFEGSNVHPRDRMYTYTIIGFACFFLSCASSDVLQLLCLLSLCRAGRYSQGSFGTICMLALLACAAKVEAGLGTLEPAHCSLDSISYGHILPRPIPTPARARLHLPLLTPADLQTSDGDSPCSAIVHDVALEMHGWDFTTLLEVSVAENPEHCFLEARAVLETLLEYAQDHTEAAQVESPGLPSAIRLEHSLSLSRHQQQALDLQRLLPHSLPHDDEDWLDADLTAVLNWRSLPLEVRTNLVNIPIWHNEGAPPPERIEVYTDGSASAEATDIAPCAWAFSVFFVSAGRTYLRGHASAQSVPPGTPYFLGEVLDDALTAELLALCWALCWAAQYTAHLEAPICFLYDAQGAGYGTFGKAKPSRGANPTHYTPLTKFAVTLRQYLNARRHITHTHVKGHSGCLGNELCDALAKLSRQEPASAYDRCLPEWPAMWAQHPLSDWAWATVPGQIDVPRLFCFEIEVAMAQHVTAPEVPPPQAAIVASQHPSGEVAFTISCVGLNVLTLRDKKPSTAQEPQVGMRVLGRKDILKASLHDVQPLLVGLQETRLPADATQPDPDYYVFNAAATEQGTGGCSLWIAKQLPVYTCQGVPAYIRQQDVTVTSVSSRHLVAHVQMAHLQWQVHVLHAPSVASVPISEVRAFWDARAQDIIGRPEGSDFIVMCDANSRLGDVCSDYVSNHGAETEGAAGELFHEFLTKIDAIVPSTWSQWHTGPHTTWVSPTGHPSRIDYVLIPRTWQVAELHSRTLPHVEHLQLRDDHIPVHLLCRFTRHLPKLTYTTVQKRTARPPAGSAGPRASSLLTNTVPVQAWDVQIDDHYDTLADAWRTVGSLLTPSDDASPRQPYLTVDTLALVRQKGTLRLHLRLLGIERKRRWKLIGLAAFINHADHRAFNPDRAGVADTWLCELDALEAATLAHHLRLTREVRHAVAIDRTQYLEGLVHDVAQGSIGDPKALYKVLRRAFPAARSSRRQGITPLPMLKLADGTIAQSTAERAEAWRSHFSSQEAGLAVTNDEYVAAFKQCTLQRRQLDVSLVPTLATLECNVLAAKSAKAAGPDGITAELLRLDAPITARQLLPVFLKACLKVQEPITFRGGDLVCLAKRAGQVLQCDAYRSILVSSVPGKLYHRSLRESLKHLLVADQPAFQAGVAPGQGIEATALAVRSFHMLCRAKRVPASLTFFDLQAAFYQVIRQSLVPGIESDVELLRLLHCLRLPDTAVQELHDQLLRVAQLPSLGASSHAVAVVQDLFRGTWFRLSGSTALTITKRGSRPGDPTADLMFGFTLSALAKAVQACLDTRGLLPCIPTIEERPDFIDVQGPVPLGFPSWADDFVAPQTGADSSDLIDRTSLTITTVVDFATSAGMTIKFGRDKTAIIFPPEALQDDHTVTRTQDEEQRVMQLRNGISGDLYEVPIVESYRHLGGIVVSTGTPVPDLHFRFSQAVGTLHPLRRKLFGSRAIPMRTRSYLLRSLVISRFAHSASAMLFSAAYHTRIWEQHYVALWRALYSRRTASAQIHCLRVLHEAHALSPPLALAHARAGFIRRLAQHDPCELFGLLWDHWVLHPSTSWFRQIREDIEQVAIYVPQLCQLLSSADPISSLLEAVASDPSWWPRQVKAAELAFFADLTRWFNERLLGATSAPRKAADDGNRPYACYLCDAAFPLRKHLHTHLARAHQVFAPARHYALGDTCAACLKVFPHVRLLQQHLKSSDKCLLRCLYLHPPLDYEDIRALEEPVRKQTAKIAKGQWRSFTGVRASTRAPQAYGPFAPTAEERLPDPTTEDIPLTDLACGYKPAPALVVWISDHVASKSREGPRTTAHRFWGHKPTFHLANLRM